MVSRYSLLYELCKAFKLALRHNENIKAFDDISRHLKLETALHGVNHITVLVVHIGARKPWGQKCRRLGKPNGKRSEMKGIAAQQGKSPSSNAITVRERVTSFGNVPSWNALVLTLSVFVFVLNCLTLMWHETDGILRLLLNSNWNLRSLHR